MRSPTTAEFGDLRHHLSDYTTRSVLYKAAGFEAMMLERGKIELRILVVLLLSVLIWSLKSWAVWRIRCAALLWYVDANGIQLPAEEDMQAGIKYAAQHFVEDLFMKW